MLRSAILFTLAALAAPAAAREVVLSFGYDQFSSHEGADIRTVGIETYSSPGGRFLGAQWAIGFAAEIGEGGVYWIGLGPAGRWTFGQGWFFEASVMPGYFGGHGNGTDLGSDLEFRSFAGVGRQLSRSLSLSVVLSHKSNANIGDSNPGQNGVALRTRWSF